MQRKYLMVTSWDDHWDRIKKTYYTSSMLKGGLNKDDIKEDIQTIFIKINKANKKPEKGWAGKISEIEIKEGKIFFKPILTKELSSDEIRKFSGKQEGWYLLENIISEGREFLSSIFYPPFFYILYLTNDWKIFEGYIYCLLKLIGINEIYKFEEQRGLPDGFFKIGKLAVLYDCTLEKGFESAKKSQIDNYCSQLSKEYIDIGSKRISIKNCEKQVWIITKKETRLIKEIDEIKLKEISFDSLFNIYDLRTKGNWIEKDLVEKLANI